MQNRQQILDELRSHPCKVIVTGFIVNPFGPTLAALLMLGMKAGIEWKLYRVTLNPFLQELTALRAAKLEEVALPSSIITEYGLGLKGAPTIVLFGSACPDDELFASMRRIALASDDFRSTVESLRRFPGNPWDRFAKEVHKSTHEAANLIRSKQMPAPHIPDRKVTEQDIVDYCSITFDQKNLEEELKAFYTAWQGSIDHLKSLNNFQMAETAMLVTEIVEALNILMKGG